MTVSRKAQRILELALKINNTPTERELTGNKSTVFVWFSGQVNLLNIRIHSNGWSASSKPDYESDIYLSDDSLNDKPAEDKLDECISILKDIWHMYRPVHTEELTQAEEVAV